MKEYLQEYRGENVIAGLTARLMPPNDNYADCMCDLLLTKYHLYVLEDNYDDTYTEHFVFTIRQLQKIGIEKYAGTASERENATQSLLSTALGMIMGVVAMPSQRKMNKFFVINYINENGDSDKLYFQDLENTPMVIKAAFQKVKENA